MMVRSKLENGSTINYMDAQKLNFQMAPDIGGNSKMIKWKVMEYLSGLMETDTWGNSCKVTHTGTEYTPFQMKMYTKDNTYKTRDTVMDIKSMQMEMNIMESIRIIKGMERESNKRKEYYSQKNTKKMSASARLKY